MGRLVVEALGYDWNYIEDTSAVERARISVSVCDAATGAPVTGLVKENFTVKYIGGSQSLTVSEVTGALQTGFYAVYLQGTENSSSITTHYGVAVSAPAGKGQTLVALATTPNT